MKIILSILLGAAFTFLQTGCSSSAGVSAGHGDHQHGVAVQGRANNTGVGVGGAVR